MRSSKSYVQKLEGFSKLSNKSKQSSETRLVAISANCSFSSVYPNETSPMNTFSKLLAVLSVLLLGLTAMSCVSTQQETESVLPLKISDRMTQSGQYFEATQGE